MNQPKNGPYVHLYENNCKEMIKLRGHTVKGVSVSTGKVTVTTLDLHGSVSQVFFYFSSQPALKKMETAADSLITLSAMHTLKNAKHETVSPAF